MARILVVVFSTTMLVFLGACSAPLQVDRMTDQSLAAEPKTLALLTRTAYDADVRRYLSRRGFKVKRYVARKKIEEEVSSTRKEIFKEAESKYGLSVYPGSQVDYCVVSDGRQLGRAVFEVSDLTTNEVILFVEAGGWTSPCAYHQDIVWDKLASALAKEWK